MWHQRVPLTSGALLGCALLLAACADAVVAPGRTDAAPAPPASQPLRSYNVIVNPWGTYDEIHASSQADEPDDGVRWRCPEEPVVYRTWRITLTAGQLPGENDPEYLAHFTFAEGKYFIGYVGRSASGLPLADYRFYETAYSHDQRFIARPYGRLTLMCRGTYTRLPASRVWSGQYWVVAHEGTIDFGPAYTPWTGGDGGDAGDGGCGGPGEYMTGAGEDAEISDPAYDPYASSPSCGGTGGGGSGDPSGSGGESFAELCGSLNGKLYYDFACLEVWNEKTGDYETVWCGTAAFCET